MRRLLTFFKTSGSAAQAGAFMFCSFVVFTSGEFKMASAFFCLLIGATYGVSVRALISFFPVEKWGLFVVGFIVGPLPIALVLSLKRQQWGDGDDRAGAWFLLCLMGALIGLVEWARESAASRVGPLGEVDELGS
jgi:di/tricarboxylate transporter